MTSSSILVSAVTDVVVFVIAFVPDVDNDVMLYSGLHYILY